MKVGAGVRDAMFVQNVAWAFSLLVLLEGFVRRLIGDGFAAKIAPPLLFFSGGLGFIWFFSDYAGQAKGFFEFLNALPKDYTIGNEFRWGNSLITLFITQRSLLLGMPIALIVLGFLWKIFSNENKEKTNTVACVVVGAAAGLLPLIHLHSLAVLFVVTVFLLAMNRERWREFFTFGFGVCVLAIPVLVWSMSGSATRATEFFSWHFGFDAGQTNIVWFWIKNTGLFIPLIGLGIYLWFFPQRREDAKEEKSRNEKVKGQNPKVETGDPSRSTRLIESFCAVYFSFHSRKRCKARAVGMGQHKGSDLLVCRLAAVRGRGDCLDVAEGRDVANRRSGLFLWADLLRLVGCLADGFAADQLPGIRCRRGHDCEPDQGRNAAECFVSKCTDLQYRGRTLRQAFPDALSRPSFVARDRLPRA